MNNTSRILKNWSGHTKVGEFRDLCKPNIEGLWSLCRAWQGNPGLTPCFIVIFLVSLCLVPCFQGKSHFFMVFLCLRTKTLQRR